MGCPRRFLIVRYHIDDLEASEAEEIREHLETCERCREILAEMERRRQNFLKCHPVGRVIPELLAEVERRERSWWWRLRMWWQWWRHDRWLS